MKIKLNEQGLLPAIAQDANTGEVLMMGYMNPGSLKRTVEGVQVWFYSRSREDLWHKGEMSGNYLNLKEAWLDCGAPGEENPLPETSAFPSGLGGYELLAMGTEDSAGLLTVMRELQEFQIQDIY